jgi:hypothetical protein
MIDVGWCANQLEMEPVLDMGAIRVTQDERRSRHDCDSVRIKKDLLDLSGSVKDFRNSN